MRSSSAFKLDRHTSVAVQLSDHLREKILTLNLKPGLQISRLELQQRFGLSQTPVRDALQRLAEEGLVDIYPQYATFVSKIDLSMVLQTHMMRRAVEQEAVHTIGSAPPPGLIDRLKRENDRMLDLVGSDRFEEFAERDSDFHSAFYEAAGISDILLIIRRSSGHLDRLRWLNLPHVGMLHVVEQHNDIISALERADAGDAEEAMKTHLLTTTAMIGSTVERYPEYFVSPDTGIHGRDEQS